MTPPFDDFESSVDQGRPLEVFTITIGSNVWRFTSSDAPQVVGVDTYTPQAILRSEVVEGREERGRVFEVDVPAASPFALLYANVSPADPGLIEVRRFHADDGPTPETIVVFTGQFRSIRFSEDGSRATIASKTDIGIIEETLPRESYMQLCNAALGDNRCKVNLSQPAFTLTSATVSAVDATGLLVSVPGMAAYGDSWFNSGSLRLGSTLGADQRQILGQIGDLATISHPFPGDVAGALVDVVSGCLHDLEVSCDQKFGNSINYRGYRWIPGERSNPFVKGLD